MMLVALSQLQDAGRRCTEQAVCILLFCFSKVVMTELTCATENIDRFVSLLQGAQASCACTELCVVMREAASPII